MYKTTFIPMRGYVDLHCHPVPGIDDGAKTAEDGAALLAGLKQLGFDRVVATPHIRSGVWDNRADTIAPAHRELENSMAQLASAGIALPRLDLAAEHLFDDVGWELFQRKEAMLYPGGRAALIEFPYDSIPLRVETRLWRLGKNGTIAVLAHPERYASLYRSSEWLKEITGAFVRPALDLMSLTGAYGTSSREAALRMLDEGLYFAACSDAHKATDINVVATALELLKRRVGSDGLVQLLIEGPRTLLEGTKV